MVIGFDGSRALVNKKTGTENYSYQILHNLSLIDHNNTYIVYIRPNSVIPAKIPRSRMTQDQEAGIQTGSPIKSGMTNGNWPKNFKFITLPYSRLWTQFGLAKQTFIDKLDVLFVPAHTLPIIRKPGLKTVVTVHDLGAEYLPATHQLKQRLYLNYMTRYQLKSASQLIAVSQATKKDLTTKIQIPSYKISVVYEGYNNKLYTKQSISKVKKITSAYGLVPDAYFLFVGTIQPRKNLERLIKSYSGYLGGCRGRALLPKLVLAGSKGWLSDRIYQLPKELGIEDQVKFLGYVPDEDLPALYSGAIACLFPSLFEGFGLPILEAMACGCPVLTSNLSSLPEVAGDAAILIDPYSVQKITEGIKKVQGAGCRRQLIKSGLEQVKRFSWKKAAEETLKVLQAIV